MHLMRLCVVNVVLFPILCVVCLAIPQQPPAKETLLKFQPPGLSWEEVTGILRREQKPGFLFFTLEGCGPCKAKGFN